VTRLLIGIMRNYLDDLPVEKRQSFGVIEKEQIEKAITTSVQGEKNEQKTDDVVISKDEGLKNYGPKYIEQRIELGKRLWITLKYLDIDLSRSSPPELTELREKFKEWYYDKVGGLFLNSDEKRKMRLVMETLTEICNESDKRIPNMERKIADMVHNIGELSHALMYNNAA